MLRRSLATIAAVAAFLLAAPSPSAEAAPLVSREVRAARMVERLADGVVLEATRMSASHPSSPSLPAETDATDLPEERFQIRITLPRTGALRLEAGPAALMETSAFAPVRATPGQVTRIEERDRIRMRRDHVVVEVGLDPLTIRFEARGPSGIGTPITFGDSLGRESFWARWDSGTGRFYDAWVGLQVSSHTLIYGGFPEPSRLDGLTLNGTALLFPGPQMASPMVAGTHPPPPPPIPTVLVTDHGWGVKFPPIHTTSIDLIGQPRFGSYRAPLSLEFQIASPAGRRGRTAPISAILSELLLDDRIPLPPRGLALDPGLSRDSQHPPRSLIELYVRARSLDIPVNILLLHEWRAAPEVTFLRVLPGPGETFGVRALQPTTDALDTWSQVWTGSRAEGFAGLRRTLRSALAAGLSGLPAAAYDILALLGQSREERPHPAPDLYRRWIQLAAFSPVMQIHGRGFTHEPWLLSDPGVTNQFRDYAWLHVNLKPYLEDAASRARPGLPLQRALVLDDPVDTETWNIDDSFLLGDNLYVAPILDADRTSRAVYLPAGDWNDFWTDGELAGGRWLAAYPAPADRIPVFARSGSVLPLALGAPCIPSLPIPDTPRLTLRFYPDDRGEAAGSVQRERGEISAFLLPGSRGARVIRVSPRSEPVTLWLPHSGAAPRRVTVGSRALPRRDRPESLDGTRDAWTWDPDLQRILVRLSPGPGRTVTLSR